MTDLHWTPVRFVRQQVECACCWEIIPAGKPGTTTGTRGTKAYYCAQTREFECMRCRGLATERDLRMQALERDAYGATPLGSELIERRMEIAHETAADLTQRPPVPQRFAWT